MAARAPVQRATHRVGEAEFMHDAAPDTPPDDTPEIAEPGQECFDTAPPPSREDVAVELLTKARLSDFRWL